MDGFPRTIFHVDMDAFFVSVEELSDPSLKGKAVVVGGQRDERGVVSAASYEARKFGVHSAMPLRTAAKQCPHAIFVDGHPDLYQEYSHKAREVLHDFSPAVEMASIDEAYLDMTGTERLHGPPLLSAHKLHQQMKERTGLNCSIGIGATRLMAKISSDKAKPNGVLYVLHGQEESFLAPLDVGKIPGVGKVTKARLNQIGIIHIGDLLRVDQKMLEENFGKWGQALVGKARGEDAGAWFEGEVGEEWQAKSISHEHTFDQDTCDPEIIQSTLAHLVQKVAHRLREHKMVAGTITLKLRDLDFQTITRAVSLKELTQLDCDILHNLMVLLNRHWNRRVKIRLIGVALSGLGYGPWQEDLFEKPRRDKMARLYRAADQIRDKFGFASVLSARTIK
jgi:DNA polymerase-4